MQIGEATEALSALLTAAVRHPLAVHEAATAIVHVSAVVAVLCAAYAGFDRATGEASHEKLAETCRQAMEAAAPIALPDNVALLEYFNVFARRFRGRLVDPDEERRVRFVLAYYMLSYIRCGTRETKTAARSQPTFTQCIANTIHQQLKLPLLHFFRSGFNVFLVAMLAFGAMASFFFIAYCALTASSLLHDRHFLMAVFAAYAGVTVFIFLLGTIRLRLTDKRIETCCKEAATVVNQGLSERTNQLLATFTSAFGDVDSVRARTPLAGVDERMAVPSQPAAPAELTTRELFLQAMQRGEIRQYDPVTISAFQRRIGDPGDFLPELQRLVADRHLVVGDGTMWVTEAGRKFAAAWKPGANM